MIVVVVFSCRDRASMRGDGGDSRFYSHGDAADDDDTGHCQCEEHITCESRAPSTSLSSGG